MMCFALLLFFSCACASVCVGRVGVLWTLVSAAMLMGCVGRVEVLWTLISVAMLM